MDQPLLAAVARRLARQIIETGSVGFTRHAETEMAKDQLASLDVINVLRGGVYAEAEWENAGWRHQVFTQRIAVVIEFESESELTIVTAWRKQ
ncbi:MAG: DUF4258 domain-containing protein [Deltaproteobacteria bacterium]|nr:MAG: DUF4258 domain-containing protein [Deltaproteobacteria bacterium]TMQ25410.1 MAG: DUF4258 domain-containing protein [Deltaproteobacteria bacterium]